MEGSRSRPGIKSEGSPSSFRSSGPYAALLRMKTVRGALQGITVTCREPQAPQPMAVVLPLFLAHAQGAYALRVAYSEAVNWHNPHLVEPHS